MQDILGLGALKALQTALRSEDDQSNGICGTSMVYTDFVKALRLQDADYVNVLLGFLR